MILTRLGNKRRIATRILPHFPAHDIYIEMFFGAGGMFFSKPRATYNIVNDLDSDVYNLYQVILNNPREFVRQLELLPLHDDLWAYWRDHAESEPLRRALRFLFLSNNGFMGKPNTLKFSTSNFKRGVLKTLVETREALTDVQFMNCDFRRILPRIDAKGKNPRRTFIYADPPYLGCANNYESSFTTQDSVDLFDVLTTSGLRFAMSEFDNPFIVDQARTRGLNIIEIGERRNLNNRRTELLFTNYD